jgi:hypothetical protein
MINNLFNMETLKTLLKMTLLVAAIYYAMQFGHEFTEDIKRWFAEAISRRQGKGGDL